MNARQGEPNRRERFESAVLVHLDAAYNLARWLMKDAAATDDVVQEASLRAYRFFDGLQGPSPKAWFMAIVRNACMDELASRKRERGTERFDEGVHDGALLDASGLPATPEGLASHAADVRQLHACLSMLPNEFREVLVLREMAELSYREISSVVGVPMGTVMSRLSRAREQLTSSMRTAPMRKSS